jgi:hypothetical protein
MSDIFITDIVGTNTLSLPTSQAELAAAAAYLDDNIVSHIDVTGFLYWKTIAWVRDCASEEGGEGTRSFCCKIEGFAVDPGPGAAQECPSAAEMDDIFAEVRYAFENDIYVSTVGAIHAALFFSGHYEE